MKKFLIKFICFIYSTLSTKIEKIIYYRNETDIPLKKNFYSKGFDILTTNQSFSILNIVNNFQVIKSSDYFNRLIVHNSKIEDLMKYVFQNTSLISFLKERTGFNYKINFFLAYETKSLPEEKKTSEVYANNWHKDKPFSQNTLKIIIPIEDITDKDGGLEIISPNNLYFIDSLNYKKNIEPDYIMTEKKNTILSFLPNLCYHRAGSPSEGRTRKQIMFQLNPHKYWCYSSNIFKKQFFIEEKFPFFNHFESVTKL
jgi:hypothetical protein